MDIAAVYPYPVAVEDKAGPVGGIGQLQVPDPDILAVHKPDHLGGTRRDERFLGIAVALAVQQKGVGIAVNPARAAERHILHAHPQQQMAAADIIAKADFGLVLRAAVGPAVIPDVGAALNDGARFQLEFQMAAEPDGTAEVGAGRHHDASSSLSGHAVHGGLDGFRIQRAAIAPGTEIPYRDIPGKR